MDWTLDIEAARDELACRKLEVSEIQDFPWRRFVFFSDLEGNGWRTHHHRWCSG